jgi:hypothetical protein
MSNTATGSTRGRRLWRYFFVLSLITTLLAGVVSGPMPSPRARAQGPVQFDEGIDPASWYRDHEFEHAWRPDYLHLATGDPTLRTDHGVYDWPYALDSIGWSIQSYQHYGGTPYFHHGLDMMKVNGTNVFNRSGGQVVNIENYVPGNELYWEVAVLDPDGYIWQYHHVDEPTIPQYIWDKYAEYLVDPVNGGFIPPDTYIGDIVFWPVMSFGKRFNHIHLNILAQGGVYVNGFEFHNPLPDTEGPEIQGVGLLKYGQIYPGNEVDGDYSLYVHARDLVLDDVYYLPPYEITFSVDGGPTQTTWRFDTLPGGADQYAYLHDFYVVPPTCGDYGCRDYYIDLGFIPNTQFEFPCSGGEHSILVTVSDYVSNTASQVYTYTVTNYAPIADPQSVSTLEDTALDILLTGSDQNCDELTFSVISGPSHGILAGTAPTLTYTPTTNYNGADAFTFVVSDGLAVSDPAVVDITVQPVNDPPVADPQSVTTTQNIALEIVLTGSDPDDDPLTFSVVAGPSHGILAGTAPTLTYTPTVNYTGVDTFTFVVSDGLAVSDPAVVDITVQPVNDPPVADPQMVTTTEDTSFEIVLTGSDPDEDPLTFSVIADPSHGILAGTAPTLTYTPSIDYYGVDTFTFVVSDGLAVSDPAVVDITVQPVNDPPVADPQAVTTVQGRTVAITLTGSDLEGAGLTYTLVTSPSHGVLGGTAPHLAYTPTAGHYGIDTFTFIVNDGELDSEPAMISITVRVVFYLPVVVRP